MKLWPLFFVTLLTPPVLAVNAVSPSQPGRSLGFFLGASPYDTATGPRYEVGLTSNDCVDHPNEQGWVDLALSKSGGSDVTDFKDVGHVDEIRLELLSFGSRPANHEGFAWFFGVSYFWSEFKVKTSYWNQLADPKAESIKASSFGFNIGIGHRWRFGNNFFLGVDWIKWSQPAVYLAESYDKQEFTSSLAQQKDLEDANQKFKFQPRLELLKVRAGYFF